MTEPSTLVTPVERPVEAPAESIDGLALLLDRLETGPPVPIAELVGMRTLAAERGRVVFAAAAEPRFANPMGGLHGGLIATLLDSALGCAAMTVLPAGQLYTTLTLEVKYLRATPLDGTELVAEGTVVHAGRRQITVEGSLTNAAGKTVATATSTCMVLD